MFGNQDDSMMSAACPSHEAWVAYSENRCDKQQERDMELHLLHCPMCMEAVEVYMQGKGDTIETIHEMVGQHIRSKKELKRPYVWKIYGAIIAAASVLYTFFMFQHKPEQTSQNNTVVTKDKQSKVNVYTDTTLQNDTIKKATEVKTSIKWLKQKNETDIITTDISKNDNILPDTLKISAVEVAPELSTRDSKQIIAADDSTAMLVTAKVYYSAQQYTQAINAYKTIIKSNPTNQEALFFLAKSEIAIGMYQNALQPLQAIYALDYYYEAQWELAQSCLKINKVVKAKRILKALSNTQNPFQAQALSFLRNFE